MTKVVSGISLFIFILTSACSGNLFTTFSNEQSDAALLEAAEIDINHEDYSDALLDFPEMSTSYQSTPAVLVQWASAYAGEAGLNALTLANNINSIGSTPLFLFLLDNLDTGSASTMTEMLDGQNKLLDISTNMADLDNNELTDLAIVSMANVGVILSEYADISPRDGDVDPTFDPCDASIMPDSEAEQIGVSLNLAVNAITQLGDNGVSFGPEAVSSVATICTELTAAGPPFSTYSFCGVTDASSFTADQILGIRSLIKEGADKIGVGNQLTPVCSGDITVCHC